MYREAHSHTYPTDVRIGAHTSDGGTERRTHPTDVRRGKHTSDGCTYRGTKTDGYTDRRTRTHTHTYTHPTEVQRYTHTSDGCTDIHTSNAL